MIRATEGAMARFADERFGSRVLAHMSGELVGACEAPVAVLPGAQIGLFACERNGLVSGAAVAVR